MGVVAGAVALRREAQPLVFFLTDGHPTVGETDSGAILENVKKANEDCDAAIFSLAFGRMADFQMLKLLSLQNNAFARKIYVAADASLQLEGFYKEVSRLHVRALTFIGKWSRREQNCRILNERTNERVGERWGRAISSSISVTVGHADTFSFC